MIRFSRIRHGSLTKNFDLHRILGKKQNNNETFLFHKELPNKQDYQALMSDTNARLKGLAQQQREKEFKRNNYLSVGGPIAIMVIGWGIVMLIMNDDMTQRANKKLEIYQLIGDITQEEFDKHAEQTVLQKIGSYINESLRGFADTMHAPKFKAEAEAKAEKVVAAEGAA